MLGAISEKMTHSRSNSEFIIKARTGPRVACVLSFVSLLSFIEMCVLKDLLKRVPKRVRGFNHISQSSHQWFYAHLQVLYLICIRTCSTRHHRVLLWNVGVKQTRLIILALSWPRRVLRPLNKSELRSPFLLNMYKPPAHGEGYRRQCLRKCPCHWQEARCHKPSSGQRCFYALRCSNELTAFFSTRPNVSSEFPEYIISLLGRVLARGI